MTKIIQMRGLPGSGKSTFAKNLVDTDLTFKRVNRDDLRGMIDHGRWSKNTEKHIIAIEQMIADYYVLNGFNLVVDDTGFSESQINIWQEFAKIHNAELEVKFIDTPLEECIKRDNKRANGVGEKVLKQFYRDYLAPKPEAYEPALDLPEAIIVDIDGTLAHNNGHRSHYDYTKVSDDEFDDVIADLVDVYCHSGAHYNVIMLSGREDSCREDTEAWFAKNGFFYDHLFMRKTGDNRKDAIIKREIFDEHIRDKYNVKLVLDDRNQVVEMWRGLGLKTLQVADGDF